MNHKAISKGLRSNDCNKCPFSMECYPKLEEPCMLSLKAADLIDDLQQKCERSSKELQAVFRLGQMDMKESICNMLRDVAEHTLSVPVKAVVPICADMVAETEVPYADA